MSRSQFNKTCVNLVKTATLTVGVVAGILSVTYPRVELGLDQATAQSEPQKPNVVVIMADDLSVTELEVALSKGWMSNLRTHVINRGTTFSESFVSYSLCCPSRSTFLTGQYPHNHGVVGNSPPTGGVTKLRDGSTLATWLQRGGYRTSLIGKYLNGYGQDRVAGDPSDNPTYIPPGWSDWQATTKQGFYNYTINDNRTLISHGTTPKDYQTDVLARRSVRFINESEQTDPQPFFLFVTPFAPHLPATPAPRHSGTASSILLPKPPSFNEQDVSDKPLFRQNKPQLTPEQIAGIRKRYQRRLESLRAIDDLVGSVVSTLRQNSELDNTVLIFTSDNGYLFGEHRVTGKTFIYEKSIRVPLYIRAPGLPSQLSSHFVINNDLAPTIADFAKAAPGIPVDGRSLIPLLRDPSRANWRKRFLVEDYKATGDNFFSAVRTSPRAIATRNQVYAKYAGGQEEFYDLNTDPDQLQSLHAIGRGIRRLQKQILQGRLSSLKECEGATCRRLEND